MSPVKNGKLHLVSVLDEQDFVNRAWINLRQTMGDVDAWMNANDNLNGRNACAIDSARNYHYFKKLFWKTYIKTTVLKARQ